MSKVSPIAAFLVENKAISKRDGNVWRFYNKQGLCLGRQIKFEQGGLTAYYREIYGDGFKKLCSEYKYLAQKCAYYKNMDSLLGMDILISDTFVQSQEIDFLKNLLKITQKIRKLINPKSVIEFDQNTGVGIYAIQKPFIYDEKILTEREFNLKHRDRIKHTFH